MISNYPRPRVLSLVMAEYSDKKRFSSTILLRALKTTCKALGEGAGERYV